MARQLIPVAVVSGGSPLSGVNVQVNLRAGGTPTVYAAETGAGTTGNPLVTNTQGMVTGWLPTGKYNLVVSDPSGRVATFTQAWDSAPPPPTVTSLPTTPDDADEIYFVADATNGIVWHLKYRAASASTYKWEYMGGGPLVSEVFTSESTASTTFTNLTTVGPQITLPLAGDYKVSFGATVNTPSTGNGLITVKRGAVAAADADAEQVYISSITSTARSYKRTATAAGELWLCQYRFTGASSIAAFSNRFLEIVPIRVG